MAGVSIEIDLREFEACGRKAADSVFKEVSRAGKESLTLIQKDAKAHHRFKSHSGNAERSIMTEWKGFPAGGNVYLETGIAKYSQYLHRGFPYPRMTWAPDPFVHDATDRNENEIVKKINQAASRGLVKAGFR